jgi:hypothetical protein
VIDARRYGDPTMSEPARLPRAVLWRRNGHVLFVQQGSGRTIGFGQIRWHQDRRPDPRHDIVIVRSRRSPSLFRLNNGPYRGLEAIAADIVDRFVAGPPGWVAVLGDRLVATVVSACRRGARHAARARGGVHCWLTHGCKAYERMDATGTVSVKCPICGLVFWRRTDYRPLHARSDS